MAFLRLLDRRSLAAEKVTFHRSLTLYHWRLRLLSPQCWRRSRELTGLGKGTHIVSLVKVDGAGDRRETLIPVMTVPVHS